MEETRRVLYGGDKADEGYFFRLRSETRRVPRLKCDAVHLFDIYYLGRPHPNPDFYCEVPTRITHMRDFREPACRPCAYMRGPDKAAGHLLQGHSQGRPQGRQATSSARHAHVQASCYSCERASNCRGVSAASL